MNDPNNFDYLGSLTPADPEYWLIPYEADELPDEGFDFDCGYSSIHEICFLAGTEECDWDCPYRRSIEKEFEESAEAISLELDCPPSIRIDP